MKPLRISLPALAAFALLAAPAQACTNLPADSHTRVAIDQGVLRVCVDGRSVEVARGVAKASAAGHRVAWISQRRRGNRRIITVTLARVGREPRVLRRFVARRERLNGRLVLGVVLTQAGDLAWSAGRWANPGIVAVKQPGKPQRRLSIGSPRTLELEDGRTLRWMDSDGAYDFFDLAERPCPARAAYSEVARNDRIVVTRATYGNPSRSAQHVLRGCDLQTGRDRVLGQQSSDSIMEGSAEVIGVDRTWAITTTSSTYQDDTTTFIDADDVVSGRSRVAILQNEGPVYAPAPLPGAPIAVASDATMAWVADGALYGVVAQDTVKQLDRGTITDLRAEGATIRWTRDGTPGSYPPTA